MRLPFLRTFTTSFPLGVSRRSALRWLVASSGGAILADRGLHRAAAQEATPAADECVATAPPAEDGVGFASLLVGGIIHDMPPGPIEIRISRFTLEPGVPFPPGSVPYPALMYIETGASDCPGGADRVVYGADGEILDISTDDSVQHIPTGTTQYIPAGVPDGAGNEGTTLMSSLVIEFVPVEEAATGTPAS